jgi:hypothetical protein
MEVLQERQEVKYRSSSLESSGKDFQGSLELRFGVEM